MKQGWKHDEVSPDIETIGRLDRLLRTETELEAMIEQAKREAEDILAAAKTNAAEDVRHYEAQLEQERRNLRLRIDREADDTIRKIRSGAQEECARLEQLDGETIDRLARRVVDHLIARPLEES